MCGRGIAPAVAGGDGLDLVEHRDMPAVLEWPEEDPEGGEPTVRRERVGFARCWHIRLVIR
jgi:hypothetical protein